MNERNAFCHRKTERVELQQINGANNANFSEHYGPAGKITDRVSSECTRLCNVEVRFHGSENTITFVYDDYNVQTNNMIMGSRREGENERSL